MGDAKKTKAQLVTELELLRARITELEQTQTAAPAADSIYQKLFDETHDALYVTTLEGEIVEYNDALLELLGCSADEVNSINVRDLFLDSTERERQSALIEQDLSFRDFPIKLKTLDDRIIDCLDTSSALQDEQGNVIGFKGILHDVTELRAAEQKLRAERDRMQSYLNVVETIIVALNTEGIVTLINRKGCQVLECNEQEIIGKSWFNTFIPEWGREAVTLTFQTLLNGDGQTVEYYENSLVTSSGEERLIAWHNASLLNADGKITGTLSSGQDITESKQAERALLESEERYRALVDHAPVSILTVHEGKLTYANPTGARILGYAHPADLLGVPVLDLIAPQSQARIIDRMTRLTQGPDNPPFLMDVLRTDGSTKTIESVSVQLTLDGKDTIMTIGRDITARLEAERALKDSEARYEVLFNTMLDGYALHEIILDEAGTPVDYRFLDVNPAFESFTGLKREAVLGKTVLEVLPGTEQHWIENYGKVALTGKPLHYENYSSELGKWFAVEAFSPQHGQFAVVFQDITDRKTAEQKLEQYHVQLEDLVQERTAELETALEQLTRLTVLKDEFVANVSHELRTPIASLKLYHKLLTLNPAKQERYLDRLQREINRLSGLIESLLRLSRLEQDQVYFDFEAFDLNQLVIQYASDRKLLVMSQELELIVQADADLPPVRGDAELLGQVFSIILTNATNYTPPGGMITVTTLTDGSQGRRRAGFRISDTGPGISPEEQPRLFERFFRGKVARKAGTAGTGLGLSIALEIVERHAGTIEVQSAGIDGQGTAFTVWIPVET